MHFFVNSHNGRQSGIYSFSRYIMSTHTLSSSVLRARDSGTFPFFMDLTFVLMMFFCVSPLQTYLVS